jgi:hypothetical protein
MVTGDRARRRRRGGGVPPDAFAVVMATGIVAVAARETAHPPVAAVLAVAAGAALAVLALWSAIGLASTGTPVATGPDPLTRWLLSFSAVAACDVVVACLGPGRVGVAASLGVVAAALWLLLVPRTVAALWSRPPGSRSEGARGGWLLGAVATESLALTAAHLAGAGVAVAVLLGVAVACWALGLVAYVAIAVPVVRRIVAARGSAEVLTPDAWVLMGALAIATLAGCGVVHASRISGVFPWTTGVVVPVLVGLWAVGTAWIPGLVAGEVRRARRVSWRYERARWATVFPLGMYSAACSGLAVVLAGRAGAGPAATGLPAVLRDAGHVAFWVALGVWCLVAVGLVRRAWRRVRPPRSPGGAPSSS